MPLAIIEDRRRATGPLMIARADGEPLHADFEEAIWLCSDVKVTVTKGGAARMARAELNQEAASYSYDVASTS